MDAKKVHLDGQTQLGALVNARMRKLATDVADVVRSYGEGPISLDQSALIMQKIDAALDHVYPPTPDAVSALEGDIVDAAVKIGRAVRSDTVREITDVLDRKGPPS